MAFSQLRSVSRVGQKPTSAFNKLVVISGRYEWLRYRR